MQQDKAQEIAYYENYGDAIDEHFDEEIYHRWFQTAGIPEAGQGRVLDAGCGSGAFGKRLAQKGFDVTGVDLSEKMASRANHEAPDRFLAQSGDLENSDLFAENWFDGIIFGQVLHHFPNPIQALTNCAKWIKSDGWMVIVEPNGANPVNRLGKALGGQLRKLERFEQAMGTVNEVHVTPRCLMNRLKEAGFTKVELNCISDLGAVDEDLDLVSASLRSLMKVRSGLYEISWRCLPKSLGATTLIARAMK